MTNTPNCTILFILCYISGKTIYGDLFIFKFHFIVTGSNILPGLEKEIVNQFTLNWLNWKSCKGITSDGDTNMTRKHSGVIKLLEEL